MGRVARAPRIASRFPGASVAAWLAFGSLACSSSGGQSPSSSAQPTVVQTTEGASITIYRDGDRRLARPQKNITRLDGNSAQLEAIDFDKPTALVVETAKIQLDAGRRVVPLPRVPREASASSLWVQSLDASNSVRLDSVLPRRDGTRGLLGRRARARLGDASADGVVVSASSKRLAIRTSDGRLWVVSPHLASVAADGETDAGVVAVLDVAQAGTHELEVGYATRAIDWTIDHQLDLESAASSAASVRSLLVVNNHTDTSFANVALRAYSGTLSSTERFPILIYEGQASVSAGDSVAFPLDDVAVKVELGFEYRPTRRIEAGDRSAPLWGQASSIEVSRVAWLTPAVGQMLAAGKIVVRSGDALYESVIETRVSEPNRATVVLAPAPKLSARRLQKATRKSRDGEVFTESIEIALSNQSGEPRTVSVVERLLRSSRFELVKSDPKGVIVRDRLSFEVELEGGQRKVIRYTVRYSM